MKNSIRYFTPIRLLALMLVGLTIFIGTVHGLAAGAFAGVASSLVVQGLRGYNPHHQPGYLWFGGATLAEIFIPEIYADIQTVDNVETSAFVQSGVVVANDLLTAAARSGTKKVEIPFWGDLSSSNEPNYSDETEDESTPENVDSDSMDARNAYLNNSWGATDLAGEMSRATPGQGDPMTRIKNRTAAYWLRHFQARVIAAARGVLADNVANDSGDMLYNIAAESTGAQSAATKISADAVIEACFTFGDRFQSVAVIALHSVVYKTLIKQQLIEFVKDANGTLLYETYLGKRLVVDDGMPVIAGTTSGLKYLTVLFGAGAFGYGEGMPEKAAEVHREPTKGKGAGREMFIERKTWMIHPKGIDWTETTVTSPAISPTLANLALAANWNRKIDRKLVPLAFLQTNA